MLPHVARSEHPGKTLLDFLEEKKISQKKFAELIWKTPIEINYVIKGTRPITTDLAIRIWVFFDTWADIRLSLQKNFDIYKLRKKAEYESTYNLILQNRKEFLSV